MRLSRASGLFALSLLLAATACTPDPISPPVPVSASAGVLVVSPELTVVDSTMPELQLVTLALQDTLSVALPAPSDSEEVIAFQSSPPSVDYVNCQLHPVSPNCSPRTRPPGGPHKTYVPPDAIARE